MDDNEGVLGRLPRSRPGTRSEKRADTAGPAKEGAPAKSRPAAGAARAAKTSEQRATKASRPAKGATGGPAATKAARGAQAPKTPPKPPPPHAAPPEREPAGDPITGALRAGVKVAEGGVKLAGGLTRELLRRLPRP